MRSLLRLTLLTVTVLVTCWAIPGCGDDTTATKGGGATSKPADTPPKPATEK
jgi:hypothetical protein